MESFSSSITQTSSVSADRRPAETSDCGQTGDSSTRRINVLITERLAAEEQTNLAFKEALNRMRTMREGLQAQLGLIAPEDRSSAQAQSRNPSDVPTPPAPSKDVTTEALPGENAARPPAHTQAALTEKVSSVQFAAFPLPKASHVRNHPSRSRIAAVPTAGPSQPTRPLKVKRKHDPKKPARSTDHPPTASSVPNSFGTDSSEAVAQSSSEARSITTTTQERKATVCLFTRSPSSSRCLNFRLTDLDYQF
jgi:hypothetical protein